MNMNKLIIGFCLPILLYGKTDFYYSYINPDHTQVSNEQRKEIEESNNLLILIRDYVKQGQYDTALKHMFLFENTNKVDILKSEAILLHAEILYKMGVKTKAVEADQMLEDAIYNSKIRQDNLLEAYRLLILLKIRINKQKEAEYYTRVIENSFDKPEEKVFGKISKAQIFIKKEITEKLFKCWKKSL